MKELIVISGKGGTGKTSMVSAFSFLAKNAVLCDADVDAADLHLIMAPSILERHDFKSGHRPVIDLEKCTQCGLCQEMCRWNSIDENFVVNDIACEGCGVCYYFCPEKAIDFPECTCGEWFISDTRFGPMVHARLGIAEENSGKLVALVRQKSRELAQEKNLDIIITDGPPGVGCPVIASLGGADAVLIVTEPTVSGKHDMMRVVELARHFRIPAMICINKYDLNINMSQEIETFAKDQGVEILGCVPFNPIFTHAMVQGKNVFEYAEKDDQLFEKIKNIWNKILEKI